MSLRGLSPWVCVMVFATPAAATSVAPMRLSEVAAESAVVQRARVATRQVRWGEHLGHRAIVTELRFEKIELLKGEAPIDRVTVFGGTVEAHTMTLIGQTELRVGDDVFLFFEREHAALPSPFVGIWRGVYPVRKGQVHNQGRPVIDFVDGYPTLARDNEHGISAAAFQAAVKRALATPAEREAPRAETPIRLAPPVRLDPTPITSAPADLPAEVLIEELTGGGTDEVELADRAEHDDLPAELADELPLGFTRPSRPFGTGAVAPRTPTFAEEAR